jgi:hypothetical protein
MQGASKHRIHAGASNSGHLGVSVIRPWDHAHPELDRAISS